MRDNNDHETQHLFVPIDEDALFPCRLAWVELASRYREMALIAGEDFEARR